MSNAKVQEAPAPVIVVRRIIEGHGDGHHGGAWKVAYADFATAMMAFFMLLWILGATTEKQRKGIADYFSPTKERVLQPKGGTSGILSGHPGAGDSPGGLATGQGVKAAIMREDQAAFAKAKAAVEAKLAANAALADLKQQVKFTLTREGLRIEMIERAGFAMFELGTDRLTSRAAALMDVIAHAAAPMPNPVAVRGHTDSLRYADGAMNNWKLSSARAEATREHFSGAGVGEARFARVEGVADTQPFVPAAPADPRNRRISVTLLYRDR